MGNSTALTREIEIAREVQMSTLPDFLPVMAGFDVAGRVWPIDETGGDTFDLVALDDNRMFVLLADATGHGIGPALSALQVQSMLRVALRLGASLTDSFRHINSQMVEDLPDGLFVTACFGLLDTNRHTFEFHSAGQGPILHFHADTGEFEWYEPSCFPLGFMEHKEEYETSTMTLAQGDVLALISDGIYEFENEAGDLFGMEGVAAVIRQHHQLPMAELMLELYTEAAKFGGSVPQGDDITIVLLKDTGKVTGQRVERREFSRNLASLEQIFNFTEEFFITRGVDCSLRYPVDLALDELFTNMVKYNADEPRDVGIEFTRVDGGISVQMTDHQATPFDITSEAPEVDVDLPAEKREERGLGLHLVKKMVESLDYKYDDGICAITFSKKLEA